jgi:hypothetical protein
MRITHCLTFVALFSIGCVVHDRTPPPPPYNPPPPSPSASVPTYRILPGAVTVVDASQPGYGLTANVGGSYRAVWTGNDASHYSEFRGYIYTPRQFVTVYPGCVDNSCALESGDSMNVVNSPGGGQEIDFDTIALDRLDGVDFTVPSDSDPVEFYLEVQGQPIPTLVFFTSTDTGAVSNPASLPFALVTN